MAAPAHTPSSFRWPAPCRIVALADQAARSESGGMADAQGSGPCEGNLVGVQVPPLAPRNVRYRRMKTQLDMNKIAKGLGAERPGLANASGGYFGAMQLLAEVQA